MKIIEFLLSANFCVHFLIFSLGYFLGVMREQHWQEVRRKEIRKKVDESIANEPSQVMKDYYAMKIKDAQESSNDLTIRKVE
jgi:hypothetical protein